MQADFGSMFSPKRSMLLALVTFLMLAAGPSAPARAGIILGIESVNASAGAFDVFLMNTGPSAVSIDTTQFEINASSSQVNLTSATTATTAPYIFGSNSFFGPTISTATGQTLDASDTDIVSDVSIASGATVGLGHIFFTVTGTLSAPVTISFTPDSTFTSLADQGNNVPINTFNSGTISPGTSSVPEPASIVQVTLAVLLGGSFMGRRGLRRA